MLIYRQKEFVHVGRIEKQIKDLSYKIYKGRAAGEDVSKHIEAVEKLQTSLRTHAGKKLDKSGMIEKVADINNKLIEVDAVKPYDTAIRKLTKGKFKTFDQFADKSNSASDDYFKLSDYLRRRRRRGDRKFHDKLVLEGDLDLGSYLKKKGIPSYDEVELKADSIKRARSRLGDILDSKKERILKDSREKFKSVDVADKIRYLPQDAYVRGRIKKLDIDEHNLSRHNKKSWNKLEKEAKEEFERNGGTYANEGEMGGNWARPLENKVNLVKKNNPLTNIHEFEHVKDGEKYREAYKRLTANANENYSNCYGSIPKRNNVPIEELRADNGIIRRIKNNQNLKPSQKKQMIVQAKKFRKSQLKNGYNANI